MRPTLEELSDTERAYVHTCERFASEVIARHFRESDRTHAFPHEVHTRAYEAGIMNAGLPREAGGLELPLRALALGGLAMARVCAPTTFTMGFNHGALRPYLRFGTPFQREAFVSEIVRSRGYGAWCMTEPDSSGSDLLSMSTVAERVQGGFVIRGEKCMTGNGTVASVFAVLADARERATRLGPTILAVPRGPGVEVSETSEKLGFRCLPTPSVRFHEVFVPDSHVVGAVGGAVPVLLDSLDYMRFGGGIVMLGLVDGALADIVPWLESRYVYGGERLVDTSHVQITLGRLVARRKALDTLLFEVGHRLERKAPVQDEAATLKLLGSELAVDATSATMQLHGWRGIDARESSEKRFRDARQTTIYEGTSEIQAMNLFKSYLRTQRSEGEP